MTDEKPTITLEPEHEREEYEPPTDEEVAEWYESIQDHYSEEAHAAADARYSDYEGDDVDKTAGPQHDRSAYERADDALLHAIQRSSWWVDTSYDRQGDLQKAPGIWRHGDHVPQYVRTTISEVINDQSWDWIQFDSLDAQQVAELKAILDERLTQPQGWSIRSLAEDIQEAFGFDEQHAVGMASDTSHGVLNTAREEAYEDMEGSEEFVYKWIGPADHRRTEVCREITEMVEDRGGAVTMPTLKAIVQRVAQKYEGTEEGGTPQFADDWMPHYQCRHTFVREVRSI